MTTGPRLIPTNEPSIFEFACAGCRAIASLPEALPEIHGYACPECGETFCTVRSSECAGCLDRLEWVLVYGYARKRGWDGAALHEYCIRNKLTLNVVDGDVWVREFHVLRVLPNDAIAPCKPQYVYFIEAENGFIKIGTAADVAQRLRTLQCGSPLRLRVAATTPGGTETERDLHEEFARHRAHGEWFRPGPDLLEFIETLRRGAA